MDPARLALYRSLGFIAGLAVRMRVPLPMLRLTAHWWMLVANEPTAIVDKVAGGAEWTTPVLLAKGERASRSANESTAVAKSQLSCTDNVLLSPLTEEKSPSDVVDGVIAALGQLEEEGPGQERLDEVLTDARFVAPLSNGQVTELIPGGESRKRFVDIVAMHTYTKRLFPEELWLFGR